MTGVKNTVFAIALMMVSSAAAWAQAPAAPAAEKEAAPVMQMFGVVDMTHVMKTSAIAKDVFNQFEIKGKSSQEQMAKEENELRAAQESFLKKKETLSKEAMKTESDALEAKFIKGQQLAQNYKQMLSQGVDNAVQMLQDEAMKYVNDVAKEKKFTAIFSKEAVLVSDSAIDITDAVIARMDKEGKKIVVQWGEVAPVEQAPRDDAKK